MNAAARVAAVGIVTAAVVLAVHPHRHATAAPPQASETVRSDPAVGSVAATFLTAVGDVDPAHPHGDLTALAAVTAPALLAAIRGAQPTVPTGARQRVHVVDVATVEDADGAARVFLTALLSGGATADSSPVAVGYLLTLRCTATGWQVTGVVS